METVISPDRVSGHVIQKYHFKVLTPEGLRETDNEELAESGKVKRYVFNELSPSSDEGEIGEQTVTEERPDESVDEESEGGLAGGDMVEGLLKRVEELSDELVKTQMKLEKQERELEEKLSQARKEGFEEGRQKGEEEGKSACMREVENLRERMATALESLEEGRRKFLQKVDTIEEELIETALDLAKEVIAKEIGRDSKEIAHRLARLLLTEVKEAASVTLKVSPEDYDYLKEKFQNDDRLQLVADPSVAPGGVVVISDIGSIDGEIMQRFERIKEAVFGTVK